MESRTATNIDGVFKPGIKPEQLNTIIAELQNTAPNQHKSTTLPSDISPAASATIKLQIPANSLHSGNSAMERDMHHALKADSNPEIVYELQQVKDARWWFRDNTLQPIFELTTAGTLQLAGVEKPVELNVRIEPMADGCFSVVGSKEIDMKSFGIKPPSAMFGLIKADATVQVVFDLVVEPAQASPATHVSDAQSVGADQSTDKRD